MNLLKRMRTRTGILSGFLLLLVLMLVITFQGLTTIRRIDREYSYLLEYPMARYTLAQELGTHFMDARRTMNRAAMYIHDLYNPEYEITGQELELIELRRIMDELFAAYRTNLANDPRMYDERRERVLSNLVNYEREVHHYFDHYINGLLRAAREYREVDAIYYVRTGMYTINRAMVYYNQLYALLFEFAQLRRSEIAASANRAFWSMHLLAILSVLVSAAAAILISITVTRPTRKVALALNTLATGGFNIAISEADATNKESTMLIRDMLELTGTIKAISSDINELIVAAADDGDLHHVICTEKYTGEWRDIVSGLNRIAAAVDAPIVEIRDVMSDLTRGHFGHKVQGDYKGDFLNIKDSVNNTIDSLVGHIETELKRERELYEMSHELERKKLAESFNERLRTMFEAAPLMIEFWNRDFILIDCNQTTLDYYGVTDKIRFIKNHPHLHQEPDEATAIWNRHLIKIFENGRGSFEFHDVNRPDGKRHVAVDAICINIDGADIVATYSSDITEIRKLQEEQHNIKIAEESSRAKSNFLARMSHEIRTPIAAVMGISEIQLQNHNLPLTIEESFAQIYSSADSLLSLVNDILDLSKIEVGKMDLLQEKYETASFIVDVTHIHMANNAGSNINFILHVSENLPTHMLGDVLRIAQITNNLLSNAFKYTSEGSVELSFACRDAAQPNQPVILIITVKDTGLGMTQEQLAMLSMDYTRFHERENRLIGGTGLGVPIVFSLVDLMGAEIEYTSMVGKGTQVTVSIPQTTASTEFLGKPTACRLEEFQASARKKRFTLEPEPMPYGSVLVVDGVDANLYVARGLLELYDLNITTCESGYDALELIHSGNTYDIIFMDYMMPGIDGLETLRKLRERGYTAPIIALTANAMIGQAEEFMKEGFDGFISKPIQTRQLHNALLKHIKDKQTPETIAAALQNTPNKNVGKNAPNNDDDIVTKLRLGFKQDHSHTFEKITQALETGDTKTATLLAHTIKGLAGLILENDLAKAAEAVEIFLHGNASAENGSVGNGSAESAESAKPAKSEILEKRVQTLAAEMANVLSSIELPASSFASGFASGLASPTFDKDLTRELFDKLEPLLASRLTDAQSFLDDLKKIPESAVLVRQIQDFDLKQAAATLKVLRVVLEC